MFLTLNPKLEMEYFGGGGTISIACHEISTMVKVRTPNHTETLHDSSRLGTVSQMMSWNTMAPSRRITVRGVPATT